MKDGNLNNSSKKSFINKIDNSILKSRLYKREEDIRGAYFRDITAIIHSYPFRRLKHKTQVFFSPKNDHICTRIEHVLHVATISATICRALNLDSDLAWAISVGHDLGHAPFGHVGEEIISKITKIKPFHHEHYSLYLVDNLINYGKGLNLTYAVRDGIAKHCGEKFEKFIEPDFEIFRKKDGFEPKIIDPSEIKDLNHYPATYEGCVVWMSDKIAYVGRDLEDALQLKIIKESQIPDIIKKELGIKNNEIIDKFVNDIINTSKKEGKISFSDKMFDLFLKLKNFNYNFIYKSKILNDYFNYFERVLKILFEYLCEIFDKYKNNYDKYKTETNFLAIRFGDFIRKMETFYSSGKHLTFYDNKHTNIAPVVDYITGMTDDYALECIYEIMIPKKFEFKFDEFLLEE
ncbi:MAG: HD domain-containing protein [Spirochaetes bacterium]|nr:HD domain-containing protein [Spirochaetota bacterium]